MKKGDYIPPVSQASSTNTNTLVHIITVRLVSVRVHNVGIRGGAKESSTYRGARGISRKVPWKAWSDEAGDWMGAVCLLEEVSRVGLIREVLLERSHTPRSIRTLMQNIQTGAKNKVSVL